MIDDSELLREDVTDDDDWARPASGDSLRYRRRSWLTPRRAKWWTLAVALLAASSLAAFLSLPRPKTHPVEVQAGSPLLSTPQPTDTSPVEVSPSIGYPILPAGVIVDGRVVRPILVDDGTLTVEPASSRVSPAVTLEQAEQIAKAAQTYSSGPIDAFNIGFGIVDLSTSVSNGLPAYSGRPAWVALWGPQSEVGVSCPAVGSDSSPLTPTVQVVLIDSQTGGDVLQYRSNGNSPCGGPLIGPSVGRALENISIPWTALGETSISQEQLRRLFPPSPNLPQNAVSWTIRYTLPPCASEPATGVFDSSTDHPILYIEAQLPISPPPSCSPAKTVTQDWGPETTPINKVGHAPTGIRDSY